MNTTDGSTKWFSPGEKVRAVDAFGHGEVFTVRATRMGKYAQGLIVDLTDEQGGLLCLSVDEVQLASEAR